MQMSIFETPLDSYETRALALRTEVLQRADRWDEATLTKLISMLACIVADDPVTAVANEVMDVPHNPPEWQKIRTGIATIAEQFRPDIHQFHALYLEAATHRGPWTDRQGWRNYVNNLIDLFEYGEKGRTAQ